MAYNRNFDMGAFFENISKAAQDFGQNIRENGMYEAAGEKNANSYTGAVSCPPANIYTAANGSLVFEFALAGFNEAEIDLSFQGDFMVLSAARSASPQTTGVYLRHDIDFAPVEKRKFQVPAAEYNQEAVSAVFKNGLLTVTIPSQEPPEAKNKVPITVN
ncbi:MAG: Hsp20/alpha crystallin family protein [Spirochaetaceae bacterium]|jgi:HSP20 family molecular chaperone IbpA|nr:Hsp20/alpha crystallin family protein [Spirochaetaceae bacterium]